MMGEWAYSAVESFREIRPDVLLPNRRLAGGERPTARLGPGGRRRPAVVATRWPTRLPGGKRTGWRGRVRWCEADGHSRRPDRRMEHQCVGVAVFECVPVSAQFRHAPSVARSTVWARLNQNRRWEDAQR